MDFVSLLFNRPLILLIIAILISIPLLLWLARSPAKPARKLKYAVDELVRRNLQQHPELETGSQEFSVTGVSFNQIVSTPKQIVTAQQHLLTNISHELRTPLTKLQLATA